MSIARPIILTCLAGTVLAACAAPTGPSDPAALKMENILTQPLAPEFTPGREVVVSLVEIPPNTTLERHWHPGEEFHYYLDGEVTIAIDGAPQVAGRPGRVGHIPYKAVHTAITGERGARILVFRVHTQGAPVR